jgi:hypothetical protein
MNKQMKHVGSGVYQLTIPPGSTFEIHDTWNWNSDAVEIKVVATDQFGNTKETQWYEHHLI